MQSRNGTKLLARAAALVMASALATLAVAAERTATFERTLPAQAAIEVMASSGEIRVSPSSDGQVHIRGVVTARDVFGGSISIGRNGVQRLVERIVDDPPIELGEPLRIGDLDPYRLRLSVFRSLWIDFEIEVPAGTEVRASTSSGRIEIVGTEAPVHATASSGAIFVTDAAGSVEASASSGAVNLENIRGSVRAQTSSGRITLANVEGPIVIGTSSGAADLSGSFATVTTETSSGWVQVSSAIAPQGDWSVQTSSGSITLSLPADAGFELNYRTSSGGFNAGGFAFDGTSDGDSAIGTVAAGGNAVEVHTSSGSLTLRAN